MNPRPERRAVILAAIARAPKAPARAIARYLMDQHPDEFGSLEKARQSVRYYFGQQGRAMRSSVVRAGHNTYARPARKPGDIVIPRGARQARKPAVFADAGKWLVLSDLHCPYHDERAVEAAIRAGRDAGCRNVYINGDLVDFYKLSRWDQDPRHRDVDEELDTARTVVREIARHFKGLKVFKFGNHDDRLETLLRQRAPELLTVPDFQLPALLRLGDGWQVVHSRQYSRLGRLAVFHGHELPKGLTSPVNVARGVYLRVAEPAITGHWHQTSTHVESSGLKSSISTCYSLGCLCDLAPEYALVNRWNHGFAIVEVGAGGTWQVRNRTINRGSVYSTE